uniref:Uncharacterized protein n=1 Tax=Rhizobium rhizogenes (strain K84 / ATCC BAA-868) TaxID=311403 RepID=B2Z3T4_RHIR8|nr:hypothetical protein [Rhizobium rhizogenes K84]
MIKARKACQVGWISRRLWISQAFRTKRKCHVVCGHFTAVVEDDALAKLYFQGRVVDPFPRDRKVRPNRVIVQVEL